MFYGIFGKEGERMWVEFSNKYCMNLLPFYDSLSLNDKEKLINYLQKF